MSEKIDWILILPAIAVLVVFAIFLAFFPLLQEKQLYSVFQDINYSGIDDVLNNPVP